MNVKKVWITCGPPGSGKSSWLAEHANGPVISRDEVRFAVLEEGDNYFDKEEMVWNKFIKLIQYSIDSPFEQNVYIDATHLDKRSRDKLKRSINWLKVTEVNALCFTTSLEVCLERNAQRSGRALVPEGAIKNMYNKFSIPTKSEEFDNIYLINEKGEITSE